MLVYPVDRKQILMVCPQRDAADHMLLCPQQREYPAQYHQQGGDKRVANTDVLSLGYTPYSPASVVAPAG